MDAAKDGGALGEIPDLVVRLEGQRIRDMLDSLPSGKDLAVQDFAPDQIIFRDTQEGDSAYLLVSGTVAIEKKSARGGTRQLAWLQEGDVFGEMALLDDPVRSATARTGPRGARALEITKSRLDRIFIETPKVARWLLKVLSHRLRVSNKMNAQMEEVQAINRRIIDGQDQERRRIARDIHDGPAQQFADYMMRLQIISKLIERNPTQAQQELAELRASIGEGLDRLRKLINNLHTRDFQTSGLETAIRKFVARLKGDAAFEVGVDFEGETTARLPDHLKTTIYCLVQEAMNNIRKHARATRVQLRLLPDGPSRAFLEVEDDGVGFDVQGTLGDYHARESLGMTSMKERTELAGGRMSIRSQAGRGTVLRFEFPTEARTETGGEA